MRYLKLYESFTERKALFIHGYGGKIAQDRIKILETAGFIPFYPHIDYDTEHDVYNRMADIVKKENISCVMGTSLGGALTYYLADEFKIPGLLFNPAMESMRLAKQHLPEDNNLEKRKMIVIGSADEVIDPTRSENWFRSKKYTNIHAVPGMGHPVSPDIFTKYLGLFVSEFGI